MIGNNKLFIFFRTVKIECVLLLLINREEMSAPANFVEIGNQLQIVHEALRKIYTSFDDPTMKTGTFVMMFRQGEMNKIIQNIRLWRDVAHEEITHWEATKDMPMEQKGCYFRSLFAEEMKETNPESKN